MAPPALSTPVFGDPCPIAPSAAVTDFLARRRSASALSLRAPAPEGEELADLLTLAARVPDHGKLAPWRFVVLSGAGKAAFVAGLERIAAARPDADRALAKLGKMRVPPLSVAVVSRRVPGEIPEWEQRLSAGAACMMLTLAVQAAGYGANWITDWYGFDPDALALLGLTEGELLAGWVQIGTPSEAPLERVRPAREAVVSVWAP